MDKNSESDAQTLASLLSHFAGALDDYRFSHSSTLSTIQCQNLERQAETIRDNVNLLTEKSIALTINDLKETTNRLGEATNWLKDRLNELDKVEQVIVLGASAAEIGLAAVSADPAAIDIAVGDFMTATAALFKDTSAGG